MNAYVASVIDYVKTTHGNEPEFVQTVEEVLSSISPIMDAHPEYEKVDLLKRMVEPERMFTFRVCWMDDKGEYHTNRGWRCQARSVQQSHSYCRSCRSPQYTASCRDWSSPCPEYTES